MRPQWLPSFARVNARDLTPHQEILMQTLLPALEMKANEPVHHAILEIGIGSGEHLLARAARVPEQVHIGCEVYVRGMGATLSGIEAQKLTNVRLWHKDARLLLQGLPEGSLDGAYILFPDPWPKTRHHKRRLVNQATLDLLARAIAPGGFLFLATDWADYAHGMLEHLLAHPHFHWQADVPEAIFTPPEHWTQTRYQRKAIREGRPTYYILVQRLSSFPLPFKGEG